METTSPKKNGAGNKGRMDDETHRNEQEKSTAGVRGDGSRGNRPGEDNVLEEEALVLRAAREKADAFRLQREAVRKLKRRARKLREHAVRSVSKVRA